MKKRWSDQELQELYEKDIKAFTKLADTNEDARPYALLFTTFSRVESPSIPDNLGDLVLAKLEIREVKSKKWQSWGWATAIFFSILCGILLSFLFVPNLVALLEMTYLYVPVLISSVILFITIEYLDKKVVWQKVVEKQRFN